MATIPIISGIYMDPSGNFRTAYPVNLVPVLTATGISQGYLRPADGIVAVGTGPGIARGCIVWRGMLYAVMGTALVSITSLGVVTTIGNIGGTGRVTMTFGFSHLAIASSSQLWLYDGVTLRQNVDPDLGAVLDVVWVDGYFMTTDGTSLIVTELSDPFTVNPLKYGSSEVDPDSITGLVKVRNEVYATNQTTTEIFQNIGGTLFPFGRVDGAMFPRGAISAQLSCALGDNMAFVGNARLEPPSVWVGANGAVQKIASREVDILLQTYTSDQLISSQCWLDTRSDRGLEILYLHLPDKTLAFDGAASTTLGTPVWHVLQSSLNAVMSAWRVECFVWCYGAWWVFDTATASFGNFTDTLSSHWGSRVGWEFTTPIIFNKGAGGTVHELEVFGLPGHAAFADNPTIGTQYSLDGETWSVPRYISLAKTGARNRVTRWFRQGQIKKKRIQKFMGTSDAHFSVASVEAVIEVAKW